MRSDPWRLFFPLGLLALWAGVLHWLAFALGWSHDASSVFHGIAQSQGFVFAFALGFLMTMLPRRTQSPPPSVWLLALGVLGSFGTVVAVRFGAVRTGETAFVVLAFGMLVYTLRCLRTGARRAPASFVWLPMAFGIALVGAVMTGVGAALGERFFAWHEFGKLCVTQGMLLALVIGAGSIALPTMTLGEAPRDAGTHAGGETMRAVLAAALLLATFAVEVFWDYRLGHGLRGALVAAVFVRTLGLLRRGTLPGPNRVAMRIACAMVPIGYLLDAFSPWPRLGLHVVFAGGFAPLVLTIGLHVALVHGDRPELADRSPLPTRAMHVLCACALGLRVAAELDPLHRTPWLGAASAALLLASVAFAWLALPRCLRGSAS